MDLILMILTNVLVINKLTKNPTIVGRDLPRISNTAPGWSTIAEKAVQIEPAVTVI